MILRSIEIKNFRSIEYLPFDVEEVAFSHTFALIGANETGKSNFLEAIALVGDANAKLSLKDYTDRTKKVRVTLSFELGTFDKGYIEVRRKIISISRFEDMEQIMSPLLINVCAIFNPIKKGESDSPKSFLWSHQFTDL